MSKFGNRKTRGYASKKEARRGLELAMLQHAGKISELREQVAFELIPAQKGERACTYLADFVYVANGETVVEDAKGFRTEVYRIKRKLMLFRHGITILET